MSDTQYRKYILLFLFAWTVVNFFPGSYDVDTWYQYHAMANKNYDDWHSPWLAYLWKVLYLGTFRFFSLYLFQMTWYFAFFYYLLKLVNNKLVLVLSIGSALFFVFIPQFLMKDVHVALAWASATLILLYPQERQWKYIRYLALLLMMYGLYIRPNTLPALFPLLFIFIERYYASQWTLMRKTLVTLTAGIIIFISYYLLTYYILNTRRAYPEYKLKLMDVIGITKLSGTNYVPECVTSFSGYNQEYVMKEFSPASIDHLYWPYDNKLNFPLPTKELDDCLKNSWKNAVFGHPMLYVKNRAAGFLYYLRIKRRPDYTYNNVTISVVKHNGICIDDQHTLFTQKILPYWKKLDKLHFYDPWLWLLLNLVFFIVFLRRYIRQKLYSYKALAALQLSAVLFTLGMFPVYQIDTEFRYSYWNVFALLIGLIYYFGYLIPKTAKQIDPV